MDPSWTYTAEQWNPITYEEAKKSKGLDAYRGSKKFAELYAWDYIRDNKPHFDLVTILPPVVFGPVVHPVDKISDLNASSLDTWAVASGQEYPLRGPAWVDARDLAVAHVEALLRPEAGNRRFTVAAPEKFWHQKTVDIIRAEFDWAKEVVKEGNPGAPLPASFTLDGTTAGEVLGITYRSYKETVVDAVKTLKEIEKRG